MTAEELSARLNAHHARTAMMSTSELYHLLPAIISALRDNVRMREALEKIAAHSSANVLVFVEGEPPDLYTVGLRELVRKTLAALTESQPVTGNVESEPRRP